MIANLKNPYLELTYVAALSRMAFYNAIVTSNKRDSNFYRTVQSHPRLNFAQLQEFLVILNLNMTRSIFQKGLKYLTSYIEFVGSKKTGGYYIKRNII